MRISDWSSDVCSSDLCAALGCKHTRIAKGRLNETSFLCRDHWREVCPPHSRIRKSWRRFFRLAKKMGLKPTDRWPEPLASRYWRFWFGLIKRARRSEERRVGKEWGRTCRSRCSPYP